VLTLSSQELRDHLIEQEPKIKALLPSLSLLLLENLQQDFGNSTDACERGFESFPPAVQAELGSAKRRAAMERKRRDDSPIRILNPSLNLTRSDPPLDGRVQDTSSWLRVLLEEGLSKGGLVVSSTRWDECERERMNEQR